MADKPRVLVLGGVGFIGRNFVKYLVDNQYCSKIRVVDKVIPATAYFAEETTKAFADPCVEFKQSNLSNEASAKKCFEDATGKYNYVFNCAAETKYSQTDEVYKEKVLQLSTVCYKIAKEHGVDKYVELSTAQVYDSGSKPTAEDGKIKPWTQQAKFKLEAEKALQEMGGPLVILRPATVYGPGDVGGLAPRLITAAVYTELGEKMEFLWDGSLKVNTVHVADVCKAMWLCATKASAGKIFNLCDKNDTDQKKINDHIESIFKIKAGFMSFMVCQAAKLNMKYATEACNDKHLKPWSDLCKKHNIVNTPLTPYLDQELLIKNDLAVNGSAIEKELGFSYDHPKLTEKELRRSLEYFISQKLFPPII